MCGLLGHAFKRPKNVSQGNSVGDNYTSHPGLARLSAALRAALLEFANGNAYVRAFSAENAVFHFHDSL